MVHKSYWHKLCKVTILYPRQSQKFTNAIKSLVINSIKTFDIFETYIIEGQLYPVQTEPLNWMWIHRTNGQ